MAVDHVDISGNEELMKKYKEMALSDSHSEVRGAALVRLAGENASGVKGLISQVLDQEQSYTVISSALEALDEIDEGAALSKAIELKEEKTSKLVGAVSSLLAKSGDMSHLPYFEEKLTNVSLFSVFNFYDDYSALVAQLPAEDIVTKSSRLSEIGLSPVTNVFYRYAATDALDKIRTRAGGSNALVANQITSMIEKIKENEQHPLLSQRYQSY